MKRKGTKLNRLSPNEEAQLVQEELQRRRKLRLQQVREQERYIALQVRRHVQERKEKVLHNLAATLEKEWQKEKEQKIQTLEKLYKENLQDVGQGHRNAQQNEPDLAALALKTERNEERAAARHQKALRELITQRQSEAELRNRPLEARKNALRMEKDRSSRITSLPQPAPDPIESIGIPTLLPAKTTKTENYSVTHHHITETPVGRETDFQQAGATQAAALEAQRLEELEREEAHHKQEQQERARLRGDQALRKEKGIQDRTRLLCELGRLQQADLQRRRHLVSSVPAHIFQPLYRQDDLRSEQQRELEIAFQDLCTVEKGLRGDLILQLESEPLPLPAPSATSHTESGRDQDLDVSFDPVATPSDVAEEGPHDVPSHTGTSVPVRSTGRPALRRLLDRIREQRDQWGRPEPLQSQEISATDSTSDKISPVIDHEWQQSSSLEEGTADTPTPTSSKMSDDSIVAGSIKQPEDALTEVAVQEEDLKRQQEEQLALLEELQEKQRQLEVQLEEAQLHRRRLQEELQVQSGTSSVQETSRPRPERVPEQTSEVKTAAPASDDTHTRRLQQYQQRLLQQNRIHKKSLEEGFRRLEEYKRTLKLRYSVPTVSPPSPPTPNENHIRPESPPVLPFVADRTAPVYPLYPEPCDTPAPEAKDLSEESTGRPDAATMTRMSPTPIVAVQEKSGYQSSPDPGGAPRVPEDDSLEMFPVQDAAPLSPGLGEVRLPSPAVILQLLLRNRSFIPPTQPPRTTSGGPDNSLQGAELHEMEQSQQVREQMRRHRELLQALIRAERMEPDVDDSGSLETQADDFSHQTTSENSIASHPQPATASLHHLLEPASSTLSSGPFHSVTGAPLKNPVSSGPTRMFHFILQDLEQHKLSTIQEVDTPANMTLDTGNEPHTEVSLPEDSDYSYSVSLTPPAAVGSGKTLGSGSEITTSSDSTGPTSRLSWRQMLRLESSAARADGDPHLNSSVISECQADETALPQDENSSQLDHHTSTTLSTGSYLSSDQHDPNGTITDSSLISAQSAKEAAASPTFSCTSYAHDPTGPNQSCLQSIIDKYTKEMNESLRSVLSGGSLSPGVIESGSEMHDETGTFAPLQIQTSFTERPLLDKNSSNTTMHDVFQSLTPEMTHNDTAECSVAFQIPIAEGGSPAGRRDTTNSDITSSDWQSFALPAFSISSNEQSASGSAVFPKWESILSAESVSSVLDGSQSCYTHLPVSHPDLQTTEQ